MDEIKHPIKQLADLMEKFHLEEGELSRDGVRIRFARKKKVPLTTVASFSHETGASEENEEDEESDESGAGDQSAMGEPVFSPMTGIFYGSPTPDSPPYVKVGSSVEAGDVVGLIEAMKVFNEITAPKSGIISKLVAETAKVVNAGEVILYYS